MSDKNLHLGEKGQLKRQMTGGFMINLVLNSRNSNKILKSTKNLGSREEQIASAGESLIRINYN